MSAVSPALARLRPPARATTVAGLGGALAAAALAILLTLAVYRNPPPLPLAIGGGLALLGTLALALVRPSLAVALGVVLLAAVRYEPAPSDLIFTVVILLAFATGKLRLDRAPVVVKALIAVYLVLNVLSAVEVVDVSRGIRFAFVTFYLAVFALWLAGWLDSRRKAQLVVRAYVGAASVSALLGVGAVLTHFPGSSVFLYAGGERAAAFFKDPNVFSAFLVPAALIVLDELLSPSLLRSGRLRKVVTFVLLALGVTFSFSRAAWLNLGLGIAVMILVVAVMRGGVRKAAGLLLGVVFAVFVTFAVLSATGGLGFFSERARIQTYDTARFSTQEYGLRLGREFPFGVGPGQFDVHAPLSAHETYIRAFAEVGVLGLVTLVALFLATLLMAAGNAVAGRDTYGIGAASLLASWCGILLSGFVIDTLHWRHLWFVAALIWAASVRRRLRAR